MRDLEQRPYGQENYSVGKHRQDVIAERIGHAKTIGIRSDAEEPRSIR